MARIDATVTASDDGGQVQFTIDKNPINVPRGQHQIVFSLNDQTTNGPAKFNSADPIYYAVGNNCPSSGKHCSQLDVVSCSDNLLTVGDGNDASNTIGYRLNFYYRNQKKDLDPIIINN